MKIIKAIILLMFAMGTPAGADSCTAPNPNR